MPNYAPDAPEKPKSPAWLSIAAKKIFAELVDDLFAANVPVKLVDRHAIAMCATCLDEVQRWSKAGADAEGEERLQCAQMLARYQRDAQEWIAVIGASPKSRAQMGLRGKAETKKMGAVASILAAKRQA